VVENGTTVPWDEAQWLNRPPTVEQDGAHLTVRTAGGSDFWRRTGYGFVRDTGHALLTPLPDGTAVEVTFEAGLPGLFDQAGVLVRVDERTWVKAGVETTDGVPHLGAVVTREFSDWSMAPVPGWTDRPVTLRASRSSDALTIRARSGDAPWRMVRLAPLSPDAPATAGPYCCSPERAGLEVRFTAFTTGPADAELHENP
jgi:uncharacterized protein